ncbi:DUF155-domain-containing protein [Yamadazyma tenuis ATCC 10573]|uniref:DUF155-domain-containing protein n=1 Tax=Candida tenuis (strain ATCC 10573 / BCRC 21748 / CBS 615 / JCM 9827 / NBRC 10315 / NRRL Y-1498 / VKM Y-70) TaxID=590646 RepID=G3B1A0_CANTC|nr:DUF155-domain-containing protein [Yamadazyma tenuis ATCC 10573]EGV64918.1 DUF155-domain-containing protein [Yamadazyma tenuis ATCC 10573]
MSSSSSRRSGSPRSTVPLQKPTAKRSPSILVTDARTNLSNGARAPFAGQNYKRQQQLQQSQKPISSISLRKRLLTRPTRYADISVDKLLSNSSDIPSGQSRFPLSPSMPTSPNMNYSNSNHSSPPPSLRLSGSTVDRRAGKGSALPSRTSKTSQKLVLIPDESIDHTMVPSRGASADFPQISRSRAELMPKDRRAQEFSRMTAYFICEQFDLEVVSDFLSDKHEVKPRLYDEALYIPYALPLLPGSDGFRVKSNNSAKLLPNQQYMEKLINKSERADYLYEYYSGVETPEDANNYSMDPEVENDSTPFDPSEPQFFAPSDPGEEGGESESSPPPNRESLISKRDTNDESIHDFSKHHGEMFVFEYGIVVFWNFSETHEKNILADLSFAYNESVPLMINPIKEQDIETEEFHFDYDENVHRPRIYNDMITLRSADHLIKLTMSHAIAQSTKLGLFESRMINVLQSISRLPKKLALTGELGLSRGQLLKKSGKLFKLRSDVNLSSSILDTPNFFWSLEPALHPLYNAVRDYLEIDQRVQVINERCKVFLEFSDIVNDSINEKSTSRITLMFIIIIFLSLSVSIFEFFLEIL